MTQDVLKYLQPNAAIPIDMETTSLLVNALKKALSEHAMQEVQRLGQEIEQEPVAWPCLIDSADFSEKTITLVMQCEDYKVSAGTHWLSTTPPQRTEQEPDDMASILACRDMLDAQPVPPKVNT